MTLILVRHGACELMGEVLVGRKLDVGLTADGMHQAQALSRRLANLSVAALHCSPRRRTRQTAELIEERSGVAVEVHDLLDELEFGEWAGQPFNELEKDRCWQLWNSARHLHQAPGGESMLDAQARIVKHIHETRQRLADHTVVLVTHADMIRCALLYYLGLPLFAYDRIEVLPAAATTLALNDTGATLIGLNERAI